MKNYILITYLIMVVIGCFSTINSKYGSEVEYMSDRKNIPNIKISYQSYSFLLKSLNSKNLKIEYNNLYQRKKESLPKGGYLIVDISAEDSTLCNTKFFDYIIKNISGEKIKTMRGSEKKPEYVDRWHGSFWFNSDVLIVDKNMDTFMLTVIDRRNNLEYNFTIRADI